MTDTQLSIYVDHIDIDALDDETRKRYPRFTKVDNRWLVVVEKDYDMSRGEQLQVLKSNGDIKIVQLQHQVLYEPRNAKRGTKDVFLCKDMTSMMQQGLSVLKDYVVLLDGTGRPDNPHAQWPMTY